MKDYMALYKKNEIDIEIPAFFMKAVLLGNVFIFYLFKGTNVWFFSLIFLVIVDLITLGIIVFFINLFQNRKYKKDEKIYKAYGIEKIKKFETNVIFLKEKFEDCDEKEKEINIILNEFYEPEGLELEHKEMLKELKK